MVDSGIIETGLSDHCLVYTVLNTKPMRPKSQATIKHLFRRFNQATFRDELSRVPFSIAYVFEDPEYVYWGLL